MKIIFLLSIVFLSIVLLIALYVAFSRLRKDFQERIYSSPEWMRTLARAYEGVPVALSINGISLKGNIQNVFRKPFIDMGLRANGITEVFPVFMKKSDSGLGAEVDIKGEYLCFIYWLSGKCALANVFINGYAYAECFNNCDNEFVRGDLFILKYKVEDGAAEAYIHKKLEAEDLSSHADLLKVVDLNLDGISKKKSEKLLTYKQFLFQFSQKENKKYFFQAADFMGKMRLLLFYKKDMEAIEEDQTVLPVFFRKFERDNVVVGFRERVYEAKYMLEIKKIDKLDLSIAGKMFFDGEEFLVKNIKRSSTAARDLTVGDIVMVSLMAEGLIYN